MNRGLAMTDFTKVALGAVLGLSTFAALATSAAAGSDPRGIWFDHNGRGAVRIDNCEKGGGLCGYVVHVKEKKHADRCGLQILGNVTPSGGGWIYSPSRGRKYTVRLKRLNDSKLRVVGNASSSFFSKTFHWKKAPGDLALCGKYANEQVAATKSAPKSEPEVVYSEAPLANDEAAGNAEGAAAERPTAKLAEPVVVARRDEAASPDSEAEATSEPKDETAEVWGAQSDEPLANEEPIENEVTEVLDELISKANEFTGKLERKCKFRIPYVDRVIMIPCKG